MTQPFLPLTARSRAESHRPATPLELFFDLYFVVPAHDRLTSNREGFRWGYGHYLIYASAAAIGAGIEVAVEQAVGEAHISTLAASSAVTIPTALFLLLVTFAGSWAVLAAGLVAAATVATGVTLTARSPATRQPRGTQGA